MKTKYFFPVLFLVSAFAVSCVPAKMYYWGDYSKSLYASKKEASEENLLKHKQILEKIVEESQNKNLRVPPGVYAELGYIYLRANNHKEAIKYFELERQIYPESQVFMQRLTQAAKLREESREEKKALLDTKNVVSDSK